MKRTQDQDEKLLSEIVGAVADATRRGLAAIANSDSLAEAATWWRGWGSFAYLSAEYVTDAASDWQAIAPKRYRMLLEAVETAVKGGPGSGFFGHTGRPGEVGGSAPSTYTVHSSGSALQWKNPDVNDGLLDDLLSNYDSNNVLDAVSSELANAWDIDAETIDWYLRHVNYADGVKKDLVTKKTDFVWSLLKDWTGSSGGPESTMVAIGAAEVAGLDFDLYEGTVKRQVEWVKKNAPEFGRALHRLGAIMYSKTQAWLTERKIDSLHVFRRGDRNANRLFSSWSLHPAFVRYSGSGQYVEETIPARSILSLPVTGFGTWSEREVVALPRDTAKQSSSIKAVQSPGYIYDRNAGRYRNATTGRYVSFEQVYRLLDSLGTGRLEVMERLTHEMHNGAISPAAWLLSMQHELVRAHLQASALGAGGWQQLTAQDYQRVDRSLRQELVRMEAFGRDIRAGRVFSEAQLRNRLGMYLGTARTHYFHAMRPPTPGPDEETLERRMLGDADHCSLCVYLAMLGWQPVGMLPVPGESVAWWEEDQCLSNCQCEMFRATMSKDEAERVRGEEPERALKAAELELVAAMVGKSWDESQHPRHAAGDERGGEFAPKEGGVPYSAPAESTAHARLMFDSWVKKTAAEMGVGADRIVKSVQDNLNHVIDASPISVRVQVDDLEAILKDGRLKSQFETGDSGGVFDTEWRSEIERDSFGVPDDIDPKDRPIYGYVAQFSEKVYDTGFFNRVPLPLVDAYGPIEIVLKNDVKKRTSIYFGDSLEENEAARLVGVAIDDVKKGNLLCVGGYVKETLSLQKDPQTFYDNLPYIEAQIHGGVTVDDIEMIIVHDDNMSQGESLVLSYIKDDTDIKIIPAWKWQIGREHEND